MPLIPLVSALLLSHGPVSSAIPPSYCSLPNVRKIEVPLDYRGPKTLGYAYQVHHWEWKASRPVVINLPGGPGAGWISANTAEQTAHLNGLPIDLPLLMVDPRGVNCNADPDHGIPASTFRTRTLARDVLEVLKREGIRNYVIYGGSFGSMWATILYDEIRKAKWPLPRLVVLEGVLGRSFPVGHSQGDDFAAQWKLQRNELDPLALEKLAGPTLPFGFDGATWGGFIEATLAVGETFRYGASVPARAFKTYLDRLATGDAAQLADLKSRVEFYLPDAGGPPPPPPTSAEIMHREIVCHEIENPLMTETLREGSLAVAPTDYCAGIALDEPYDARKTQIRVPIAYLNSERDPVVGFWQAEHHYRSQVRTPRKAFLISERGGHGALIRFFNDCSPAIWKTLLGRNWAELPAIAKTCRIPNHVRVEGARRARPRGPRP